MSNTPDPEKKIIIDEDWKEQARVEKEELARKQREAEAATSEDKSNDSAAGESQTSATGEAGPIQWPEPSLPLLVTTLATQAMMALGLTPHMGDEKPQPDLGQAKHFIGTIELLLEKTEGNRTKEETEMFEEVLHQLRMGYVAISQA